MDTPRWKWNGNEIAPEVDWNDKGGGGGGGNNGNLVIDEEYYYYSVKVVNASNEPIRRASVTFQMQDGTQEIVLTDSSGRATHIENVLNEPEETCRCVVNVAGYDSLEKNDIPGSYSQQNYTEIVIDQTTGVYYYALSVVDRTSREPIPGATVEVYNINQTVLVHTDRTDENGSYIYSNTTGDRLYFKIKKNGYKESNKEYIIGAETITEVKLFRL